MIDIHCHVVPGVDDGAKDEAMTRLMLQRAKDAGIDTMIATPHVYKPEHLAYNAAPMAVAETLAQEASLPFGKGCELNYRAFIHQHSKQPSLYEQLKTNPQVLKPFCLHGTNCLLLELSNDEPFFDWEIAVTALAESGYQPIIAHPERYTYVQRDIGFAGELIAYGCELQLDAGGLMAGIFSPERKIARKMLSEGMVSYIASDAHRPEHYATFEKAFKTFRSEWPAASQLTMQLGL